MRHFLLLLTLFASLGYAAGPNVLSNTDHYVNQITHVVSTIGTLGPTGSIVDQTCPSGGVGWNGVAVCGSLGSFVPPPTTFVSYALASPGSIVSGVTVAFYSAGTSTPITTDQPYNVISESSAFFNNLFDQQEYATLTANSMLYVMPHCPQLLVPNDYPPITMSAVLPAGAGAAPGCGYDGGTEFSISLGYLGSDGSASSSGATLAGVYAVMKQNHPTWNWQDIKGALRQTASNWPTGFNKNNAGAIGYGNINYAAATAIGSTASIFLEPAGMTIDNHVNYVSITLYPFVSARRAKEVVYVGGSWPSPSTLNEMTTAQITAAGGTKIIDDGGATGVQSFNYAPAVSGTATFTVITLDASGNGSRVENFTQITQSLIVGVACTDG